MSNYYGKCRTNYFAVTDAEKFKALMAVCVAGDKVEVYEEQQEKGITRYCLLCDGIISGLPYKLVEGEPVITLNMEETEEDLDNDISSSLFHKALQDVLADGEAVIITEIGWEKMCYLQGVSLIITKTECKGVDLRDKSLELAREVLGDPEYTTKMEY